MPSLLGHLGTLLAHVQLSTNQYPQVCFLYTVFQPLCPKPVALPVVQDPALGFVELHPIDHRIIIVLLNTLNGNVMKH